MKKCLVVLAKTPGLSPLKTRLAKKIGIEKTLFNFKLKLPFFILIFPKKSFNIEMISHIAVITPI